MKSLARKLREVTIINKWVRTMLHLCEMSLSSWTSRWRVSGLLTINLNGVKVKMFSKCDDLIVDQLYYEKFDEKREIMLVSNLAKTSSCFIDIGSNTGLFSLLFSVCNPVSQVFAFEPYIANIDRLKLNIGLNQLKNVTICEVALSNTIGETNFFIPLNQNRISQVSSINGAFSKAHKQNDVTDFVEVKVPVTTLDIFVGEQQISSIDLVKIDVESLEIQVLRGAECTLAKFRPIVLCEIFYGQESDAYIKSLLQKLDYSIYILLDSGLLKVDNLLQKSDRNYVLLPAIQLPSFICYGDIFNVLNGARISQGKK